jgi:mevalonate kinase
MTNVNIPGKVMLSGEYAVLYGGTSVLVPVPRYMKFEESEFPPENPYTKVVQEALKISIDE